MKTIKMITATAMMLGIFTWFNFEEISADTQGQTGSTSSEALKATTDITVDIEKGTIIDPGDTDSDIDVEGNDNNQSEPNEDIGDDDQLAIWRIPKKMNFKGKYDATKAYKLPLNYTKPTTGTEPAQRVISIADERDEETGWKLTAKVGELTEVTPEGATTRADVKKIANTAYSIDMTGKAMMHKITPATGSEKEKIHANEFEGVSTAKIGKNGKISIGHDETAIAVQDAKKGNETNAIGKGYTGILLDNIEMKINKGHGSEGTKYEGNVTWTLSNDPAPTPVQ